MAPELRAPAPPDDLSAVSRDNRVYLTWWRPTKNMSGKPLRDLMEFRIYRRQVGEGEKGTPPVQIARVRATLPENAQVSDGRYRYVDEGEGEGLAYEREYAYFVRAVGFGEEIGPPSPEVTVRVRPAPLPPTDLRAEAGDGYVILTWTPPRLGSDGRELTSPVYYNLYRGTSPSSFGDRPVNPEPIAETRYTDLGLHNEVAYYYVVRATDTASPPWHESRDSNEVRAVPSDSTPPARPRHLTFAIAAEGVRLYWDPNPDPEVAGYFIYRSTHSGVGYRRLNASPQVQTTFLDLVSLPSGSVLYYAVSAVDSSPAQNESGLSEEVRVEFP